MVLRFLGLGAVLAALVLGCTSIERNNPIDENGNNYGGLVDGSSSSFTFGSGSSSSFADYVLTIEASPNEGGTVQRGLHASYYPYGTIVTITATSNIGYRFVQWSGTYTLPSASTSVMMNEDIALTAEFELLTYTLTTSVSSGGAISRDISSSSYTHGTVVTVTAVPDMGYKFVKWSGASTSTDPSIQITMEGNRTLTAQFEQLYYTLTTSASSGGTVSKAPSLTSYAHGTEVTLTATPNTGHRFIKWSGASSSTSTSISVTMDGNKILMAEFEHESQGSYTVNNISDYKTVTIGTQVWIAENLNYYVEGSKCYDNNSSNCTTYGRLYDWATAMALPSSCNLNSCSSQINTHHRGICPQGWHIPTQAEWETLDSFIQSDKNCSNCDAKHLKSTYDWYYNGNALDSYEFAALPGGYGYSVGSFSDVGYSGFWWSASVSNASSAYTRFMDYNYEYALWLSYNKTFLFSVRCVKN